MELLRGATITKAATMGNVTREMVHSWLRDEVIFQVTDNENRRELPPNLVGKSCQHATEEPNAT